MFQLKPPATPTYGIMVEFDTPEQLVAASQTAYDRGYRRMDAYSPFPIHGLAEATGFTWTILPWLVAAGGVAGCLTGFGFQYYCEVIGYPSNIGGRPLASWPSFVVIAFELTILFACLTAVFGMLALNGLPQPYHPVFNTERFALASKDRFFLCIEAVDPNFNEDGTREFLESLEGQHDVCDVPH